MTGIIVQSQYNHLKKTTTIAAFFSGIEAYNYLSAYVGLPHSLKTFGGHFFLHI